MTGQTISHYVNGRKVDESRYVLQTTELSIAEIAMQCGFSSANYYSDTFKQLVGIPPGSYRKQTRRT